MSELKQRQIAQIFSGNPVMEGAGVHLRRVFGFNETALFDPFLLLDDFRSDNPQEYLKGFPWHPHRGIETITYVLKGDVEHGDSLGNKGDITSGDVQWMTAGSGIIHQEMPKGDENGSMHGFQLWANLPAVNKMMDPRYRDITAADIPEVTRTDGTSVKVIAGSFDNVSGPADDIVIDPLFLDCTLPADTTFSHAINPGYTAFIYMIGGSTKVGEQQITNRDLVLFTDGEAITLSSTEDSARFLLLAGKPLKESIAWRGPIVMNSQEELDHAFAELKSDTFIKHK